MSKPPVEINVDWPFKFIKQSWVLKIERDTIKVCEIKETTVSRGFFHNLFRGKSKIAYHFDGKSFHIWDL